MKTFFCSSLLLLATSFAYSQNPSNLCDAPDAIKERYRESAYRLAYDEIYKTNSSYQDSLFVPDLYAERKLEKLLAVYNSSSLNRDTVVDLLQVSNLNTKLPELHRILLQVDAGEPWTAAWQKKQLETNQPQIDSLCKLLKLQLFGVSKVGNNNNFFVELTSDLYINPDVAVYKFEGIQGIINGSTTHYGGDGDFILSSREQLIEGYDTLTYSYGWDDCPAGCIQRRNWQFLINNLTCEATFYRSYGSKAEGIRMAVSENQGKELITLSPNPVSDQLNIALEGAANGTFRIYTPTGQLIKEQSFNAADKLQLDVQQLPAGLYLFQMQSSEHVLQGRFIKN